MENKTILPNKTLNKETPTLWKWYFGWHPRMFLTIPTFLFFVYSGLFFVWAEILSVISFFQTKPVTWGAVFIIIIFGGMILGLMSLPVYICFLSINWLYEINTGSYTAWKKFLLSIGILLLVIFGTTIIYWAILWLLVIL